MAIGTPPLFYQWRKDGTNLVEDAKFSGVFSSILTVSDVGAGEQGLYSVLVTNSSGTVTSSNALLDLLECTPPPSGLIAWWPGDGNATNLAGSGNGTLSNGTAFATGFVGAAFQFDGADDFVRVPDSDIFNLLSFTATAWIKTSSTNLMRIVSQQDARNYWLMGVQDGRLRLGYSADGFATTNGPIIGDGQWHHVAVVRDTDSHLATWHVDGALVGTRATATNIAIVVTNDVMIGRVYSGGSYSGHYFEGFIDEVALFNRALSSNEIATIYAAGTNGMCKDALPPTILVSPTNQVVPFAASVTFSVTASGTSPLSYQWRKDGTNLIEDATFSGVFTPTLTVSNVNLADEGAYTVVVTNAYGMATSHVAVLTVNGPGVGPAVVRFAPTGFTNQDVAKLLIHFSEPIRTNTFTGDDVILISPTGRVDSAGFSIQAVTNDQIFEIIIPKQSVEGSYSVVIGPSITDLDGNPMAGLVIVDEQDFNTMPSDWITNGSAGWQPGGFVRLVPCATYVSGSTFFGQAQVPNPFLVEFDFNMNAGGGCYDGDGYGADGLTFVVAELPNQGDVGGGLGYQGYRGHSFAVEFDNFFYNAGDIGSDHIGIDWNGVFQNVQTPVTPRLVDTGTWHAKVRFDGARVLVAELTSPTGETNTIQHELPDYCIPAQYTFGFTAATGCGYANHDIDNVSVYLLPGGGSEGGFTNSFVVDKTAPRIVGVAPVGALTNLVDHLDVVFDSSINGTTFTADDATITGPNEPSVSQVQHLGSNVWRLHFSHALNRGEHAIEIGPFIADAAGNEMNQDGDSVYGEPLEDAFRSQATITIADLTVTEIMTPSSAVAGQAVLISWILENAGNAPAAPPWTDTILLASSPSDPTPVVLASFTNTQPLAGGELRTNSVVAILPIGVSGVRYLMVQTDSSDSVWEDDGDVNNLQVSSSLTVIEACLSLSSGRFAYPMGVAIPISVHSFDCSTEQRHYPPGRRGLGEHGRHHARPSMPNRRQR